MLYLRIEICSFLIFCKIKKPPIIESLLWKGLWFDFYSLLLMSGTVDCFSYSRI